MLRRNIRSVRGLHTRGLWLVRMTLLLLGSAFAQDLQLTFDGIGAEPVTRTVPVQEGVILQEQIQLDRKTHMEIVVRARIDGDSIVYDAEIDQVRRTRKGEEREMLSRPRIVSNLETPASLMHGGENEAGEQVSGFRLEITPL